MSHVLTVELSDDAYAAVLRAAEAAGATPEAVAAATVEREFRHANGTTTPKKTGDITRFFGMIPMDGPVGADNEQIDADLAREYSDTHEPK